MTFDLARILQSKRNLRRHLAAQPIEQKLAMLDALRERALAIRPARSTPEPPETYALHEQPPPSRPQGKRPK